MVAREMMDCPAKINLYLRVNGKREDGYHELETVFQTIDLSDRLGWHPDGPWQFSVSGGPDYGDDELVCRAARAYAAKAGIPLRGHAHLIKRIPAGAGLGGGSSDAAGMLKLLNREYNALNFEQLQDVALGLGSDVPFFLTGGRQWGVGRGEALLPCTWRLAVSGGFILLPDFQLSTAIVFKALQAPPCEDGKKMPLPDEAELGRNDLFEPACQTEPALKNIARAIQSVVAPEPFFMSGSGSSLVWLTDEKKLPSNLVLTLRHYRVTPLPFRLVT